MGVFVRHIPCPNCGSSDAGAEYDDGSSHCFSCDQPITKVARDTEPTTRTPMSKELLRGTFTDIPARALKEETCRKYGYSIGTDCHIANYHDANGELIAQKIRKAGKEFSWRGSSAHAGLFGQHLFNPGKSVVVTEGEIDCLAVSQAFNNKYPVVSIPNGAKTAVKSIEKAYEWLVQFDKVVLCFDNDEPGREATQEVASKLPAGKVYTMKLPLKDAGETLVRMGTAPIVDAFWRAAPWRPEGIVAGADITKESLQQTIAAGYSLPYPKLSEMLSDIRKREITLLTAGTGIGKSTLAREIAYHLHQKHGLTIGNIYLEESKEKTAQGYIAIHNNVPLGSLRKNRNVITEEQWDESMASVVHDRMFFYDHFGSLESDILLGKLRYMAAVLGVDFIVLDHISIVISGQTSSSEGERRDIDILMTKLRTLVESTGVGIIAIVHLKQPEGKAHEEGGRVTLTHLRGSGSLKQIPDAIVALERDQQDEENSNLTQIRVLKNREFGTVGVADQLAYNKDTGRLQLSEVSKFANEEL